MRALVFSSYQQFIGVYQGHFGNHILCSYHSSLSNQTIISLIVDITEDPISFGLKKKSNWVYICIGPCLHFCIILWLYYNTIYSINLLALNRNRWSPLIRLHVLSMYSLSMKSLHSDLNCNDISQNINYEIIM